MPKGVEHCQKTEKSWLVAGIRREMGGDGCGMGPAFRVRPRVAVRRDGAGGSRVAFRRDWREVPSGGLRAADPGALVDSGGTVRPMGRLRNQAGRVPRRTNFPGVSETRS